MASISDALVRELEAQAGSAKGEKARALKKIAEKALAEAESLHASPELIDRLDGLLMVLIEASRDVCTNTLCPQYNKKCRMR
ncbi:MAG TPA: hypothetical protein VLB04_10425 [Methanotrichaceae archaeon]|nr:hypothetical protein [Methanotrichaceae archaeon]